jgi:sulfatase modifying factor 1
MRTSAFDKRGESYYRKDPSFLAIPSAIAEVAAPYRRKIITSSNNQNMNRNKHVLLLTAIAVALIVTVSGPTIFAGETSENSIGMKFVRLAPGHFQMGSEQGDWDEKPLHEVAISKPFSMSVTEITNDQYEKCDPAHRKFRGLYGVSRADNAAVVFVSWEDATAFCKWLSKKEGKPYRLPTEAEWEYACRAGTTSEFNTGDTLSTKDFPEQTESIKDKAFWGAAPAELETGKTPPNAWGLYDMHGNAEEWCSDWYGPYPKNPEADPVGYAEGIFKVTRGGSVHTTAFYLRSANRMGTLPKDKSWLIGFRVVLGELPDTHALPNPPPARWAENVSSKAFDWAKETGSNQPFFEGPVVFQKVPPDSDGPMYYKHNHCPAITWCPNGDLLAVWFSCRTESGREMTILGSRLRRGQKEWDDPDVFFSAPDRNMTGSALLNDGKGKLYYFNGLGASQGWQMNLALAMRTSTDSGATWSTPALINPERNDPRAVNQPVASAFQLRDGTLVLPSDASYRPVDFPGGPGTALWMSKDAGRTWRISGGTISGIHGSAVELMDGRLFALGRTGSREGAEARIPISISKDEGEAWQYSHSEFPAITGGQRLVLRRLKEGPILLVSYTDMEIKKPSGMIFRDRKGGEFRGSGMYAAVSFDEGKTWPIRRLVTGGGPTRTFNGGAWTRDFVMDATHSEPRGYLSGTQTPDGMIHIISSRLYYRFNLDWLKELPLTE